MASAFSLENEAFRGFIFYSSAVLLKTLAMGGLVSLKRLALGVFANPEDAKGFGDGELKPKFGDERVERARRNHLNDLENIPIFVLLGFMYLFTGPSVSMALLHFRAFAASRFLHTIAYQLPLPQPSRALLHGVGLTVNISMGVQIIRAAL